MDVKQIEYFIRVGELGSFTRASVMLGISQPALSRQIRRLEVELRQTLLHRNGRGVELTPAGQSFFAHGQQIIRSVDRALGALSDLRKDPRGRLVVGLPSRAARVLATPLVQAFRQKFPHAAITVAEGLSTVLHEWLLFGRVNLALLVDPARSVEMELELLHSEELVLVGPRTARGLPHAVQLRNIGRYPLILPRIPNATRSVLENAVGRAGGDLHVSTEIDTTQNILELVAKNLGFAVLPRGAVSNAGGEQCFRVAATRPAVEQHIFLATSKRRPEDQLATEARNLIRNLNVPKLLGAEPR